MLMQVFKIHSSQYINIIHEGQFGTSAQRGKEYLETFIFMTHYYHIVMMTVSCRTRMNRQWTLLVEEGAIFTDLVKVTIIDCPVSSTSTTFSTMSAQYIPIIVSPVYVKFHRSRENHLTSSTWREYRDLRKRCSFLLVYTYPPTTSHSTNSTYSRDTHSLHYNLTIFSRITSSNVKKEIID
ncbi:582_t:CDS:2, partial [Funneliformis geosporum]